MSRLFCGLVAVCVFLAVSASALLADPTFSRPVDSGAIDLSTTTFNSATNTVTPGGACTFWNSNGKYEYWWEYFQMSNVDTTKTYTFQMDQPALFGTDTYYAGSYQSYNRFVYSYDDVNWYYFNNASYVDGQEYYTFTGQFTQSTVYIASGIPFTMGMVDANTSAIKSNPYVQPTRSSNSSLVFAQTLGGTDFYGRAIPQQNLYGYQITDTTATGPKKKVVIITGTHSGETVGTWTCQGLINFLSGSDPRAEQLRKEAVFYIYPEVDPDGRYGGYFRNNQLAPLITPAGQAGYDSNRNWACGTFTSSTGLWTNRAFDGTSGSFDNETKVENAIRNDTGGSVDYFFDFHAQREEQYGITSPNATTNPYVLALEGLVTCTTNLSPALSVSNSTPTLGYSQYWASMSYSQGGLDVPAGNSFAPETGFLANVSSATFMQRGGDYFGVALYDVLPEPLSMALLAIGGLALLRRRK